MPPVKPKIIVIMGPTSSGKSDAAIRIAKKYNGEIISADSRQIYKGMNIGSGKVLRDAETANVKRQTSNNVNVFVSEGIPHHLIDVAEPMEDFNISHFKTLANQAIEEILAKGKVPIICGGTGFWIDAVVNNTNLPEVPPNEKLRAELEKKNCEELFEELKKKDPERAASIDKANKYRLVRALEIIEKLGKVPKPQKQVCHPEFISGSNGAIIPDEMLKQVQYDRWDFLQIGINVPREILNEKIKKRLEERFDAGMIAEVENLNKKGVSWQWMEKIGLEYRWISRFLQGKISLGEMSAKGGCASGAKEKLYFDIIHYAKRQMTWFKKNKKILWKENYKEIEEEVEKFLQ